MKERIQLSDHFTFRKLLRFTLPSMGMMVIAALYTIVDGVFVSNCVGAVPFAALNLIWPVTLVFASFGYMLGPGASALTAKTLGEGDREKADSIFSLVMIYGFLINIIIAAIGFILTPNLARRLGAEGELLENAIIYGRIILVAQPFYLLQIYFLAFFATAEKPQLSLVVNTLAGVTNMVLDALLMIVFRWGIAGAAIATGLSQLVGAVIPLIYFGRQNNSLLRLRFSVRFDSSVLRRTCINGISEMVTNFSTALVAIVYNYQIMRLAGEQGISAYGIIDYIAFIFVDIFVGYGMGTAPIAGYHYGAGNQNELKNLCRKSLILMTVTGLAMVILSEILAPVFAAIFVSREPDVMALTIQGMRIYVIGYLPMGIGIWTAAFFTALNNGKVAAVISFMRTMFLKIAAVLILPVFFDLEGVWLSFVIGEFGALIIAVIYLLANRKQYRYL